ncbi:MAG: arginine--tRNA ligase [Campylobacter sp.]|nr:arginine--tRNA ligase [Campylobacter sp.]
MKNLVKKELSKILNDEFVLESPKDKNLAHYAIPLAFALAKKLKKSPKIIADDLAKSLNGNEECAKKFSITSLNGYINVHLRPTLLNTLATNALKFSSDFAKSEPKNKSILIEYVSANPTGPLHIGHVRGAVYGDTLARVGRAVGYDITTEYYINDAGNQINLLGTSIFLSGQKNILEREVSYPDSYYRGDYIDDLANEAASEFGKQIFENEANEAKLSLWGKDKMLEIIKQNLASANISIQNWVSESSLYKDLDSTLEQLKKCGGVYESESKLWLKSSELGDEKDRVIIRDDSRPTYLAGDIVYHYDKFKRGFDEYINIWGADHHGYIARIKASIHFLGFNENRLEIILAQMVSLLKDEQTFKMSKRAGNFILMSDVLDEIGSDALRFIFISKKCDTPLEFDVDELKATDSSNPVFYVNYAHARIYQIFAKAGKSFDEVMDKDISNLDENALNLLFEALILNDVLEDAFSSKQLQKIPDYLKTLSANFHKFYSENRVVGSKNEDKLLKVFAVVATTIKTALGLIGIKAKEKMQ